MNFLLLWKIGNTPGYFFFFKFIYGAGYIDLPYLVFILGFQIGISLSFFFFFLLFFYYNSIAVILGMNDLNLGFVQKREQAISLIYKTLSIKKFLPRKKIYKYTFEDF